MINPIPLRNLKTAPDGTPPLGRFTLLIGAKGRGKTTAMQALRNLAGNMTAAGIGLELASTGEQRRGTLEKVQVCVNFKNAYGEGTVVRELQVTAAGINPVDTFEGNGLNLDAARVKVN